MSELVVKVTKVADAVGFGPSGGPVPVKRVAFMVGEHGPFSEDFTAGDFVPARVTDRLEAVARTLRELPT